MAGHRCQTQRACSTFTFPSYPFLKHFLLFCKQTRLPRREIQKTEAKKEKPELKVSQKFVHCIFYEICFAPRTLVLAPKAKIMFKVRNWWTRARAIVLVSIVVTQLLPVNSTKGKTLNHCMKAEKTRNGKQCRGKLYKINAEISRVTQLPENSYLCRFHWDESRRDNLRCSCPQAENFKHAKLNKNNIPRRYYALFDEVGAELPNYRPGTRWCNNCKSSADERFAKHNLYMSAPPVRSQQAELEQVN